MLSEISEVCHCSSPHNFFYADDIILIPSGKTLRHTTSRIYFTTHDLIRLSIKVIPHQLLHIFSVLMELTLKLLGFSTSSDFCSYAFAAVVLKSQKDLSNVCVQTEKLSTLFTFIAVQLEMMKTIEDGKPSLMKDKKHFTGCGRPTADQWYNQRYPYATQREYDLPHVHRPVI
jgi:hypothetical protein